MPGHVNIYDSASNPCNLHLNVENAIAKLIPSLWSQCQQQCNNSECGLLAIVNAREHSFIYCKECWRRHFEFSPYWMPRVGVIDQSNLVNLIQKIPSHCSCRMQEDHELYLHAFLCKKWFHTACEGLSNLSRTKSPKGNQTMFSKKMKKSGDFTFSLVVYC